MRYLVVSDVELAHAGQHGGRMSQRTVTDKAGRTWVCEPTGTPDGDAPPREGVDVVISCTTESVTDPVVMTVGSGWERMAENGLARLVAQASPAPRR